MDCVFCKIIKKEIPAAIVAETDDILVIKDINPKTPIHYLIIPKEHIKDLRELDSKNLSLDSKVFQMAQKLSHNLDNVPFRLVISNGYEAGQRVFHLHAHFMAGATLHD